MFLLAAVLLGLSSCKKADPPTNTELISKAWKYASFKATASGIVVDVMQQLQACKKDDIIRFKSDKSLTQEEGATKCLPTDPQVISTGTWAFSADEKSLTYGGRTATIVELTANSLRIQYQEAGPPAATIDLALVPAE
jgi:hypothetical protein